MALKFIFGGSGSGKSHYLYERIIQEAGENPGLSYLVLVPEQFTMQTQKDLVMMSPAKGIMNIDVLSFVRLAHRIFEETGKGGFPVLDDEGKNLVLRKIGGDLEEGAPADLTVFDLSASYPVRAEDFLSLGKSSPFTGRTVFGKCLLTLSGGEIAWQAEGGNQG